MDADGGGFSLAPLPHVVFPPPKQPFPRLLYLFFSTQVCIDEIKPAFLGDKCLLLLVPCDIEQGAPAFLVLDLHAKRSGTGLNADSIRVLFLIEKEASSGGHDRTGTPPTGRMTRDNLQ